jgi:hypothetical protein
VRNRKTPATLACRMMAMGIETILFVFGLIIVIAIYVAVKKSKSLK